MQRDGCCPLPLIEPGVLDGDGRMAGDADNELLGPLVEHPGVGVAEEQPADDLAIAANDGDSQVAADGQVTVGHAVVWRVVPISRVGGDVVEPDGRLAVERGREHVSGAGQRELVER